MKINKEEIKIENIADYDKLFYHVSVATLKSSMYDFQSTDPLPPHVFTPQGEHLSVNWDKYCKTAKECLDIKTEKYPNGRTDKTHGVGHFLAADVRKIECLQVVHAPSAGNDAHSHIMGVPPNKPREPYLQMRKKLQRIFRIWDIKPLVT